MNKPRLTVVLPTLNGGGAEKVFVSTAALLREDWEIKFVLTDVTRNDDTYAPKLAELGIPVIRLPAFRRLETFRKLHPLRRVVLGTKPDVVLSAITGSNAIVSLALRGTGIPHVMSERKDLRSIFATAIPRPRLYRFLTWLSYRAPNSKASIVVSDAIRERILEDFAPRTPLVSIHNGLDVRRLQSEAEQVPDGVLPGEDVPSIAFVGRLTSDKNVPLLMNAVAHGEETCRKAHLLLVGKGEEEDRLRNLAQKLGIAGRVHFLGFRSNPHAWVSRASVFAMSSDAEGFPNALAEAMLTNGHCVATDCPTGPSEIIENEKSGLLVPPGDEEAISRALERMLSDKELRERCARNARKWAMENSIENQARAYDDVLRTAAGLPAAEKRDG